MLGQLCDQRGRNRSDALLLRLVRLFDELKDLRELAVGPDLIVRVECYRQNSHLVWILARLHQQSDHEVPADLLRGRPVDSRVVLVFLQVLFQEHLRRQGNRGLSLNLPEQQLQKLVCRLLAPKVNVDFLCLFVLVGLADALLDDL